MQKRDLACFLVVVLAALVWRFAGITFDSLWLDEGYQSIVDAYGHPLPDFQRIAAQPFVYSPGAPASAPAMLANFRSVDPLTPPLYQLLLNRWIALFGGDDLALRSLSALISTLSVAAVFWTARALFGWKAALLAGLIQAFSPFAVTYGQEVRMYSLVELMSTLSAGSLLAYLFLGLNGRARAVLLVVHGTAVWALINSHYTGLFLVAFEGLLGLAVALSRRSWRTCFELFAAWLCAGILWLPWLPMFLQAAKLRTAAFYVARQPTWWWPLTALFGRIPANWVVFLSGKQVVGPALPLFACSLLVLITSALTLLAPQAVSRLRLVGPLTISRRSRILLACLFAWAIVPALLLWGIDVLENHRVVEVSRYLMPTAPAIYLLAGVGLSALRWRSPLFIVLLAGQLLFAGINNIAHATVVHQREPWREMAQLVSASVSPEQLLLVSQYYDIVCLDRYLTVPYRQVGVSSSSTSEQLRTILGGARQFALVTAQEGDRVKAVVPAEFRVVNHWDLGHSLHLLLYARN